MRYVIHDAADAPVAHVLSGDGLTLSEDGRTLSGAATREEPVTIVFDGRTDIHTTAFAYEAPRGAIRPDPTAEIGWIWSAGPQAYGPSPELLKDHLAAKRYAVEVAGVTVTIGGQSVVVSTAREMRDGMRDTILRILTQTRQDGDALKIFADGVPRAATNAEARTAITAAGEHVQAAFNVEEALYPQIVSGAITTTAPIDGAAWPPVPA